MPAFSNAALDPTFRKSQRVSGYSAGQQAFPNNLLYEITADAFSSIIRFNFHVNIRKWGDCNGGETRLLRRSAHQFR
jgi:hypothetical protein